MTHTFDTAVRPQDDFFGYVNNVWLRENPIPASESTWGTFYVLRDNAVTAVHDILQELANADETTLTHDQRLLKVFFQSALDFDANEKQHAETLQKELDKIEDISSPGDLAAYLGYAHRVSYHGFWNSYVSLDDKDSQMETFRFYQAGLSLPNRDYYLDESERMQVIRTKYAKFYQTVRTLLPETAPDAWDAIYSMEMKLAKVSWTNIELRDVQKNYTKLTIDELKRTIPFDWDAYFMSLGWQEPAGYVVVDQLSYIAACAELMRSEPLETIKAYLAWQVINRTLSWYNETTSAANFDFYGRTLNGTKEQKELWKRASLLIDNTLLGEILGREYAAKHFPESSKQAVLSMVEDVRAAYHGRIYQLTWMKDTTKQRAHRKLDNLKVFIGYPSVWEDLSALELGDNILDNLLTAHAFNTDLELAKIGKPPKAEDWEMNAHTVNAYHHPNRMEIVFPAAILQPPFFDPMTSYATNLGGIGSVIGHELTHGFDDQGSEFDENGNSNPWQDTDEQKAFFELAENIVRQADAFESIPGTFLQGKLILGEAIADVGGLQLAIDALKRSGKTSHDDFEELFTNFARAECGTATDERLVQLAKTDPHPPSRFRVNCVANHVDEFYETYGVEPSDKLYLPPTGRAQIW